ncbi:PUA-like domain-containing protein [Hyaloraphidium curvatum]|nr:PUA-like domain-containing protein [Hyaloraphidium curvatum]
MADSRPTLKLFECHACTERLANPVTLPCGRSVCGACLKRIVLESRAAEIPSTESPVSETPLSTSPTCDAPVGSPVTTAPARMGSFSSLTSAGLVVDVGSAQVYYKCPAEDCPYERHLYRKERVDVQLRRVLEVLPQGDKDLVLSEEAVSNSLLECPVCYELLVDPITAPCGHLACRECLLAAIDHGTAGLCPTCRGALPKYRHFYHRPANAIFTELLEGLHREEHQKRELFVHRSLTSSDAFVPIFVCNLCFPKTFTHLHIFEPRYRLMMHRAMQGNKRFGMAVHTRDGFSSYGTMLEIRSIEPFNPTETINGLPRFLVTCYGVYRFRVLERGMQDNYHTGIVKRIEDLDETDEVVTKRSTATEEEWETSDDDEQEASPAPATNAADSAQALAAKIRNCRGRIGELLGSLSNLERRHFESQYGQIPEDDEDFGWFLANVLLSNEESLKLQLLQMTSLKARMDFLEPLVESLARGSSPFSRRCLVM